MLGVCARSFLADNLLKCGRILMALCWMAMWCPRRTTACFRSLMLPSKPSKRMK